MWFVIHSELHCSTKRTVVSVLEQILDRNKFVWNQFQVLKSFLPFSWISWNVIMSKKLYPKDMCFHITRHAFVTCSNNQCWSQPSEYNEIYINFRFIFKTRCVATSSINLLMMPDLFETCYFLVINWQIMSPRKTSGSRNPVNGKAMARNRAEATKKKKKKKKKKK